MQKQSKRTLVPRLRFPEFLDAGEWEEKTLKRICDINPSHDGLPDSFVYIDLESVEQGKLISHRVINREDAPSRAQRLLQKRDVIYQTVRPYQQNNLSLDVEDKRDYVASTGYAQLRAYDSPTFLFQLVHTTGFVNRVLAKCTGSSYPAINSSDLASIKVAIPSSAEQRRIADCLTSLDELITAEADQLDALKAHKKGLMQQLFPREGETTPRLRFPEFEGTGEWERGQCCDIAHVLQGYGFPVRYQGQLSGKYPFYKVSDITAAVEYGGHLIDEAQNYIDETVLKKLKAKPVPEGAVIFAKIGEAIRKDRRALTTRPAVIDNNVSGVKAIAGEMTDCFLFYLWATISLMDFAGGVVPAVSKTTIETIPVSYPAVDEQQKTADCLTTLDDLISAQAEKIETLKTHKKGLMQQLFPAPEGQE